MLLRLIEDGKPENFSCKYTDKLGYSCKITESVGPFLSYYPMQEIKKVYN